MLPAIPGLSYTDSSVKVKQTVSQQLSNIFNPTISVTASSPSAMTRSDADMESKQTSRIPSFDVTSSYPVSGLESQYPSAQAKGTGVAVKGVGMSSTTLMLLGVGALGLLLFINE